MFIYIADFKQLLRRESTRGMARYTANNLAQWNFIFVSTRWAQDLNTSSTNLGLV